MTNTWALCALWAGLALAATLSGLRRAGWPGIRSGSHFWRGLALGSNSERVLKVCALPGDGCSLIG